MCRQDCAEQHTQTEDSAARQRRPAEGPSAVDSAGGSCVGQHRMRRLVPSRPGRPGVMRRRQMEARCSALGATSARTGHALGVSRGPWSEVIRWIRFVGWQGENSFLSRAVGPWVEVGRQGRLLRARAGG
jgi:hypothetical protein